MCTNTNTTAELFEAWLVLIPGFNLELALKSPHVMVFIPI